MGYIKLYRKIREDRIWKAEKFSKGQAWVDLLLRVRFAPYKFLKRGIWIHMEPGQLAESEGTLAREWKWSRDKVRRFLSCLEDDGKIIQQKSRVISIISIINWNTYQQNDTTAKTTNNTTIHKKVKKENNIPRLNLFLEKQNVLFEEIWAQYPSKGKVGKKSAAWHFVASVKSETDWERIKQAFLNYTNTKRVKDGFIQNGSTWFNNWQDWVDYKEEINGQKQSDRLI